MSALKKTDVTYIAGPMRGYPQFNFPAFYEAEEELSKWGVTCLNPARMDEAVGFNPYFDTPDKAFLTEAMERDVTAILEHATAMVMLPGWEKSTGAKAEMGLARWKHIPIYLYPSLTPIDEEDVLEEALRITGGDRQQDYGDPSDDFGRTAKMWEAILQPFINDGALFIPPRAISLCMIAVKISRETNASKRDNWTDIAGYARCGHLCSLAES